MCVYGNSPVLPFMTFVGWFFFLFAFSEYIHYYKAFFNSVIIVGILENTKNGLGSDHINEPYDAEIVGFITILWFDSQNKSVYLVPISFSNGPQLNTFISLTLIGIVHIFN